MAIEKSNRLVLLDFIRGFALWGILISNIPIFSAPFYSDSVFQDLAAKAVKVFYIFFVTGKFFVLFSFVFGYGFAILLQSIESKGGDAKRIFFRRLFGLFVLGVIHAIFLFEGDILVTYSILGVLLYQLRFKEQDWNQWILFFWILSIVAYLALGFAAYFGATSEKGLATELTNQAVTNHLAGFWPSVKQQLTDLLFSYPFILLFNAPTAAMMFLVGLWAGKNQVFANPQKIWLNMKGKKRYLFLVGSFSNAVYTLSNFYPESVMLGIIPAGFLAFGGVSFALLYVLGIIYFLFLRNKESNRFVSWISEAGSMSLSNYLMQSLICTIIFDGWGFGFYSKIHPGFVLLLTFPIYTFNVIFSKIWKTRMELGPMEWILRKWTYG